MSSLTEISREISKETPKEFTREVEITYSRRGGDQKSSMGFCAVVALFMSICLMGSLSGCLDDLPPEELPPYTEEYSEDGGVYEPQTPSEGSGYGSGYGSGSGANTGSGAAAIPEGSGAKSAPEDEIDSQAENHTEDHVEYHAEDHTEDHAEDHTENHAEAWAPDDDRAEPPSGHAQYQRRGGQR